MDFRIGKIDRYIMKKFMSTFFIAILLIIGIVIIFDISEKIDKFASNNAPLHAIVFDYYLNFIPYFMNMFSPLFVFITVIFFTSRMASNSEIIAILSCGISFHRMMRPYIFSSVLIALLSLSLSLWVIPRANSERNAFEEKYTARRSQKSRKNVHYQIAPGEFVTVESFSKWNNTAYDFRLESIENNRIVSKISAQSAVWDSTGRKWVLKNYVSRTYSEGKLADEVKAGKQLDTCINLTVEDFYRNSSTVENLPYNELEALISTQRMRGDADIRYSLIEKHQRFALPFSAIILTVMGVALSSRKRRGGIGWNLAAGIALSFSYILFLRFSQMFVYTGSLPPGVALWLPNMIFAVIAAVLYRIAPK